MNQQQFPWQQQRPQQGPVGPVQQSGAPPFVQGQAWQAPQQQFPSNAPGPQGQGWVHPQQAPQQQMPPWMTPKMPPKGNPTKKKKALWYVLVGLAILTGLVFIGTTIYYFMTY